MQKPKKTRVEKLEADVKRLEEKLSIFEGHINKELNMAKRVVQTNAIALFGDPKDGNSSGLLKWYEGLDERLLVIFKTLINNKTITEVDYLKIYEDYVQESTQKQIEATLMEKGYKLKTGELRSTDAVFYSAQAYCGGEALPEKNQAGVMLIIDDEQNTEEYKPFNDILKGKKMGDEVSLAVEINNEKDSNHGKKIRYVVKMIVTAEKIKEELPQVENEKK